ncbi:MAG TPA: response regulator [Polyangiaceae bacterium]|nr:response regulator [Polyangiaceae bacterium]
MSEFGRILLVEDSKNDRDLTEVALSESGLANELVWVKDGQEALDYLYREGDYAQRPEGHPAVVLLDLKMPRVDGLQVLAKVKGDPLLRTVPIVVLTSSSEEVDVVRSYGLGVNAYVVKPVGFTEFVSALKELGVFWAVLNQPPPGTARDSKRR